MNSSPVEVAIVDYGLGNLYSVARACEFVGLEAKITSDKDVILSAKSVILPGVGAFGDAMKHLKSLDLVAPLRYIAQSDTPLIGICLGLQLLMSESEEFGVHQGLGIIEGQVSHFGKPAGKSGTLKVPQVGWNRVLRVFEAGWQGSPLAPLADRTYMYFVHSYYVEPEDYSVVLSTTTYGDIKFCSAVRKGNVVAFQFHPERSGEDGQKVYSEIATMIKDRQSAKENQHVA